ncbi:galactose oxidase early set domain-containing protein [Streptomyces sp. NPDC006207]
MPRGSAIAPGQLIRPAAVTHSSEPNPRLVDLPLTVNADTIDLNVTTDPNLAPPGWYMLFTADANGVPSVAKWVHLDSSGTGSALRSTTQADADTPSLHIHDFARDLANEPLKPGRKRTSAPVKASVSGCDPRYGTPDVCVPVAFPKAVARTPAARCGWLDAQGYRLPLKVNDARDRQRTLPERGANLACFRQATRPP